MSIINGLIEKREKLVVFALLDRIKFVVVALRTSNRQSEKRCCGGIDPIDDRFNPELFGINPTFLINLRITVKARGNLLVNGGIRQKVARELLDRELVE